MAWLVAVQLGLLALSLVGSYLLRPKDERARAAALDEFDFPRAEEGDAVALAYGKVRISSPSVVFFRLASLAEPITDGPTVIGYTYVIQMRLLLARSNARVEVTAPPQAQLVGLMVGDRAAVLEGPNYLGNNNGTADTAGCSTWRLDEPSGSNTVDHEGRIKAVPIFFYDGRWDLARHPSETVYAEDLTVPYRGYVTATLQAFRVESTQIPTLSPIIFNPCVIPGYESTTGALGLGDVNPAAILYDLLTNPWGGVGNDSTLVDVASFVAVAGVLEDEQHGMSLLVTKPNEARDIIETILRQIDGVLYQDMNAGQYVLALIRDDYDPLTIPEFTEANVVEAPEMPSLLWSETVNQVNVVYSWKYKPATMPAQDLAGIAINGGRVKSAEIHFPGCTSPWLAATLANRELNFLSRPIYKIRMVVNREAWDLKPGDPFKFTWSRWGVSIIFRAMEIDLGTLADGRITVTGVQDRFSIGGTVFDPTIPDEVNDPPASPDPIIDRLVTEAPRWIQVQAYDQGLINSPDAQHSYSVARAEGSDGRYRLDTTINAADETADLAPRAFPATFTTTASYARTTDPYDTATGILISLDSGSLSSATAAQIEEEGRNLTVLWDADGNHEFIAWAAAADLGAPDYQLQNVWRGLLDTVPRDWPGGTFGAVLDGEAGADGLGALRIRYGAVVATHMPAGAGSSWTPAADSPVDGFTARSRTLLPVRAMGLEINGSTMPAALEEEGVVLAWADRNKTTATITRGDAADEAVESGQTYDAVAYKTTVADPDPAQVVLVAGLSSHTQVVGLGKVGHGPIEVGIDTKRAVPLPDGTTPTLRGWQVPLLELTAHHWRNLLINPRFADGDDSWDIVDAGGTVATGASGLGGGGSYLTGATGVVTWRQTLDVTGYDAENMTAVLDFHVARFLDAVGANDEVTVTLAELDSGGGVLSSTAYGPTTGPASLAEWSHQVLTLTCTAGCTSLRVTIRLDPMAGGDTMADLGVAEFCLRLGQISSQLLADASFEGGPAADWVVVSGTWQLLGATKYDTGAYTRPNDGAAAELKQTVTLPTGYELGVAVFECVYMNDAADDTGATILEALDGGGSVVASDTTGAITTATNTWVRQRLTIDPIPATATQLRVRLVATRVTGVPLNTCWDDANLRCHKHLDPDQEIVADWTEPVAQPLPQSTTAWKFAFPTVTAPEYAIFDGSATGRLGVEPVLVSTGDGASFGGKAINYDGTVRSTSCFEGTDASSGMYIETAATGAVFANFSTAADFTVIAFWKVRPGASLADSMGICGRVAGGVGWELRLTDTDGFPQAVLTGVGGAATITGTVGACDGSLHAAALVFDASAETLTLVDASGTASASTAAIGEFQGGNGKFRILWASDSEAASFEGQVLRVYMWRSALTAGNLTTIFTYLTEASDLLLADARTGTIACVVGTDSAGVVVESFGPGRNAVAYDTTNAERGLVSMPSLTNFAAASIGAPGVVNTGTVSLGTAIDPCGFVQAITVTGTSTQGRYYGACIFGAVPTVYVQWFARAATAHDADVHLVDGGVDVDTVTVSLTTSWQLFTWAANWASSGGTGGIRFAGSDDGSSKSIYLSPMVSITTTELWPGAMGSAPDGALTGANPGATLPVLDVSALTSQINREGEIAIECVSIDADHAIADLHNGTNSNDRRLMSWATTGPNITSAHYDATAVSDATAQINTSTIDPTAPATFRLRWNVASTLDGSAHMAVVRAEQGATVEDDPGRNAAFTASTTPTDELELGHNAAGGAVMAGLVLAARVAARERKATPP